MADYVVTATLVDGISDPANAAAASMDKTAASADNLSTSVTKAGRSAQQWTSGFDPATKTANAYQKSVAQLAEAQTSLTAGVAEGVITQTAANSTLAALQQKVAAARTAMAAAAPAASAMAGETAIAAEAFGTASIMSSQFTRELVILGGEAARGNYNRLPGSMVELVERTGNLNGVLKTLGNIVFGWPGLFAAGAAALGYLGYSAEEQAAQLGKLQVSLMATRDDFTAMAAEAEAAGKATAGYGGIGTTNATTAAGTIAANPAFTGTQAQLEVLVKTSADLATVWGETVPQAAKELSSAMTDPGAEADKLAKAQFPGMTQALADTIKGMQTSGDAAGAFGLVLDDLQGHTTGAATATKTGLQIAIENLGKSFNDTGANGKSMAQDIGAAMDEVATDSVNMFASILRSIDNFNNDIAAHAIRTGIVNPAAGPTGAGAYAGTTGNVLTSSAGALGIMQLMPQTATALHVDPSDAMQNIYGGMELIQQLATQFNGNTDQILAAYNGGPPMANSPSEEPYIASVKAANPSVLNAQNVLGAGAQTMTVAQAIQFWGQSLGMSPNLIALGEQIATVESGGQQFVSSTLATGGAQIYPSAAGVGPFADQAPPASGPSGSGVSNPFDPITSNAMDIADKAGTTQESYTTAENNMKGLQVGLMALAAQGDTTSAAYQEMQQALDKYSLALYNAVGPAEKLIRTNSDQVVGNDAVAAAWTQGAGAADAATAQVKAQAEALQFYAPTAKQYAGTVDALTASYLALAASQQGVQAAQALNQEAQDLAYLQAEADTLGQSAEARQVSLAVMKEQQTIENTMPLIEASEKQKILANVAAQSEMAFTLQQNQQALSDLASSFSSAFDTIGNAMAEAFVQGEGAAVNWHNVTASAIEQVVQEFLKLAVLNPILNAAFGQSNSTLDSVIGALGATSASAASSGSTSSGLLSGVGGLANLFTAGGGGTISPFIDNLGAEYLPSLFAPDLPSLGGADAAFDVSSSSDAGGLLSGFGTASDILGIGGSILPGLISGNYGQAAAGGIGAAIGTALFPGIGTILGGLAGNLLGGSLGPGPENPFSITDAGTAGGRLTVGSTASQLVNSNQYVANLEAQEAATNSYLAKNDLAIRGQANSVRIGTDPNANGSDPYLYSDLYTPNGTGTTAFEHFSFGSNSDSQLNKWLQPQTFANLTALETAVSGFETFLNTTMPGLVNFNDVTGSLNTAITGINTTYAAAIKQAKAYGLATADLATAQTGAIAAAQAAADLTFTQGDQTSNDNYLTAAATISGNPADDLTAQLAAFDLSATQQEAQLKSSLDGTYGTAYESTQAYADHMTALETSLGEQRLAIQQQYNDKLTQTADQAVSSLGSYAASLEFGSGSPISATDQYSLAQTAFQSDVTGAQGGDFNSLSDLQNAASTFLSASSAVNGSGAQYVADFNSVLDALQSVASTPTDALTASVLQSETQTQTQQLQASLADLGTKLDAIKTALNQASAAPARIAA